MYGLFTDAVSNTYYTTLNVRLAVEMNWNVCERKQLWQWSDGTLGPRKYMKTKKISQECQCPNQDSNLASPI
jgi:hypothetical protein